MIDTWRIVLATTLFGTGSLTLAAEPPPSGTIDFNRDVRPILAENCLPCHGPDASHREAELRLDVRDKSVQGQVIVPGDPDTSLLIQRILTERVDERMPPADSKKTLTDQQKEILSRWVAEGAVYQKHWAFEPPQKIAPPAVPGVEHPVDQHLRTRLAVEGLSPSPLAARDTLIRRVSLDLIGLPPTVAEIDGFLAAFRTRS